MSYKFCETHGREIIDLVDNFQNWKAITCPYCRIAALEARCREQSGANIEFLQTWMRTANPMLGGAVPLDMMYQGGGRRVAQFIDSAFTAETKGDAT